MLVVRASFVDPKRYDSDQLGFPNSCQLQFLRHILTVVLFVRRLVLPAIVARRTSQQALCSLHRVTRGPFADAASPFWQVRSYGIHKADVG